MNNTTAYIGQGQLMTIGSSTNIIGNQRTSNYQTYRLGRGQSSYKCPNCDRFYMRISCLKRHLRVECGQEPQYQCQICQGWFKYKHNLSAHMKIHMEEPKHHCTICLTITVDSCNGKKNNRPPPSLQLYNHYEKEYHRKNHPHNNNNNNNINNNNNNHHHPDHHHHHHHHHHHPPSNSRNNHLHENRQTFESSAEGLTMKILKKIPLKGSFNYCEQIITDGRFYCNQCGRSYVRKDSLQRHMHWECGKDPQFQCTYCSQRFKRKAHWVRHVKRQHCEKIGDLEQHHKAYTPKIEID
ncbi:hypothetical protein M0804_007535 [Polistes exclamans]|nr:hypothetical protein M0804_007535 [Polistes exclamans]